jgi:hypothetical protein
MLMSLFVVRPNSWYLQMHYDRLNEELLQNFRNKEEDEKIQREKEKSRA